MFPKSVIIYLFLVYLVGGASDNEGNVFAINPTTGIDGPVCDDSWDLSDVRFLFTNTN